VEGYHIFLVGFILTMYFGIVEAPQFMFLSFCIMIIGILMNPPECPHDE